MPPPGRGYIYTGKFADEMSQDQQSQHVCGRGQPHTVKVWAVRLEIRFTREIFVFQHGAE